MGGETLKWEQHTFLLVWERQKTHVQSAYFTPTVSSSCQACSRSKSFKQLKTCCGTFFFKSTFTGLYSVLQRINASMVCSRRTSSRRSVSREGLVPKFQSSLLRVSGFQTSFPPSQSLPLRSEYLMFTLNQIDRISAAQLRSVTEIAPKSPFLCVNRSPIRLIFVQPVQYL